MGGDGDSSDEDSEEAAMRLKREDIDNGFDPEDLQEKYDGWEFFKKKKIPHTMVRRYCMTLDQDYMKNKITVVAYINHIFDLYLNQRRPFMRTYADVCERQNRISSAHSRHVYFN